MFIEYLDSPLDLTARSLQLMQSTRVLLVEDDPLTRHLVRKTLMGQCQFVTANSATTAIQMAQSYCPDLVFLDLGLPDASGETVFTWLRANQPQAAIVLFTQSHDLAVIDALLVDGANGYIAKPFHHQDLMRYLLPKS